MASSRYSICDVITKIRVSGWSIDKRFPISIPFIPGISISRKTISFAPVSLRRSFPLKYMVISREVCFSASKKSHI